MLPCFPSKEVTSVSSGSWKLNGNSCLPAGRTVTSPLSVTEKAKIFNSRRCSGFYLFSGVQHKQLLNDNGAISFNCGFNLLETSVLKNPSSVFLSHVDLVSLGYADVKKKSVVLGNRMVPVLPQRGGSCSIVLTVNMFSSSSIAQHVSNAVFFFSFCCTRPGTHVCI